MLARRRPSLSPAVESFLAFTRAFTPKWATGGIDGRAGDTKKRS
jgi:hypothetical protein